MEQKALDLISTRVGTVLKEQGYTLLQSGKADAKRPTIFQGEHAAYAVIFDQQENHFELRQAVVEKEKIGEDWKSVSVWLFDPATSDLKDAESIANDFCDSLATVIRKKQQVAKAKKKEKGDERYVDPAFLINRFVTIFPELKYAVQAHKETYGVVVPHAMVKEFVNPMVQEMLAHGDRSGIDKFCELLTQNYKNGDLDTKSLITVGILNAITDPAKEALVEEALGEDVRKAWQGARKYRNKKVKPEKIKAIQKLSAEKSSGSLR